MTTQDVRKKITEAADSKWFNSVEATFNYPQIGVKLSFKGFSSIYDFVLKQAEGWHSHENLPSDLIKSIDHFENIRSRLIEFLKTYHQYTGDSLTTAWNNQLKGLIESNPQVYTFNAPEVNFFLSLNSKSPQIFTGAFEFYNGSVVLHNRDQFIGALHAYEFSMKGKSEITKRTKLEKASINEIKSELQNHLSKTEIQLVEHLKKADDKVDDFSKSIDELKENKESTFDKWFAKATGTFDQFDSSSNKKIKELEKTYEELLRLQKPAEYWKTRATQLKTEGWKALYWLIALVVVACFTLYFLLWQTPDGMLESFSKDSSSAIKWSIIYVTFIAFLTFGIRILNRAAFSAFHLARDAEEREQLTYFYLSLLKDSTIEEAQRNLIMQSLFSRADTGLLKEDSSPTMPNDFIGKIIGNK